MLPSFAPEAPLAACRRATTLHRHIMRTTCASAGGNSANRARRFAFFGGNTYPPQSRDHFTHFPRSSLPIPKAQPPPMSDGTHHGPTRSAREALRSTNHVLRTTWRGAILRRGDEELSRARALFIIRVLRVRTTPEPRQTPMTTAPREGDLDHGVVAGFQAEGSGSYVFPLRSFLLSPSRFKFYSVCLVFPLLDNDQGGY